MPKQESIYRIEHILVDFYQLEIRCTRTNTTHPIQQKPLDVLLYLIRQHPRLVTREELIEHVWDGNIYVGDKALTNAIWQLRSEFEQLGIENLIETVRKRGYRLSVNPDPQAAEEEAQPQAPTQAHRKGQSLIAVAAIVLGLVSAYLFYTLFLKPIPTHQQTVQPDIITPDFGRAQYAELSPDNKKLVYVLRSLSGERNIYWQPVDNPEQRHQLTFSPHRDLRPVWDPTGRFVLFIRRRTDQAHCSIMQVDTITKIELELAKCRPYGSVYLAAHPFRNEYYFIGDTKEQSSLYRLSLEDGQANVEHIPCTGYCEYPNRDIAVSPDGKHLALTRRANRFSEDLYVLNLDSMEERRLTHQQIDIIGISWHPSSQHILMASVDSGKRSGYLVDIEQGEKALLRIDNFGSPSRVTTNGTVYYHSVGTRMQLSYMPLDNAMPSALLPITLSDYQYRNPHLNPATGEFVFISNRSGHDELWAADANFQNIRQLTHLESIVRHPRWSHDGKKVAFVARFPHESRDALTVLDVDTGRIQRLYEFEHVLGRPTWWHDDSKLVFREKGNLQRFDLNNHEMISLTQNGGIFGQSLPTGQVYYSKGEHHGLWLTDKSGKEELVIPGHIFSPRYAWVVAPQGVYFYNQEGQSHRLSLYNFGDNSIEHLLNIPPELVTTQSTFVYDDQQQRLVIESWQARSRVMRVQLPPLRASSDN